MTTALPYLVSRTDHIDAYQILGIRREGRVPGDADYWLIEFPPRIGQGLVAMSMDDIVLERRPVAADSPVTLRGGLDRVTLRRAWRGQHDAPLTLWESYTARATPKLHIVFQHVERTEPEPAIDDVAPLEPSNAPWVLPAICAIAAGVVGIVVYCVQLALTAVGLLH